MADNITAPGIGSVIAAELISGAYLVRNKIALGTTDSDGGNVSASNPMPSNICDGVTPSQKATVAQFHNADNQSVGGTAYGVLCGGVAQTVNAAGNLDRQRSAGIDLVPMRGIITGSATFVQEVLATSTTSVTAAASTATLTVANTTGFQVGGTLNFEPSFNNTFPSKYESATITAVSSNTSVTVAFPSGGALYSHTQPYTIQTFVGNQERDFSGEQQSAQGIGAAIAAEFESNSGGPPLTSGLATGWTLDADRNLQGKNNTQMAITSTTAGNTSVQFTNNPWTSGLVVGQSLILSVGTTGAAVETVIVSKNNTPVTGAGPITVNIVNPVVNNSSTYALFDSYGLNVPTSASAVGVEDCVPYLYDSGATDPKKPLSPWGGNLTRGADTNVKSIGGQNVTQKCVAVTVTPTITASSAYTTGNGVGGVLSFTGAVGSTPLSGLIVSAYIDCKSTQTCTFTLYLFNANPTSSTFTDKSAPNINAADVNKVIGVITSGSALSGLGTHTTYATGNVQQRIVLPATTLYGVLVVTGTPTFGTTTDVTVGLNIWQD